MIQMFGPARVGRDVEVRRTTQDQAVASVSLAFSYGRKGEDGKRPTQWVDAALWGARADALAPYLVRGARVTVVLEDVHIETFKRQDNSEGTKLVGRITAIDLSGGDQQQNQQQPRQQRAPAQQQRNNTRQQPTTGTGFDDMSDDIPF
jgi:single-strand DNA-binding protein